MVNDRGSVGGSRSARRCVCVCCTTWGVSRQKRAFGRQNVRPLPRLLFCMDAVRFKPAVSVSFTPTADVCVCVFVCASVGTYWGHEAYGYEKVLSGRSYLIPKDIFFMA